MSQQEDDLGCARGCVYGIAIEVAAGAMLFLVVWGFFWGHP